MELLQRRSLRHFVDARATQTNLSDAKLSHHGVVYKTCTPFLRHIGEGSDSAIKKRAGRCFCRTLYDTFRVTACVYKRVLSGAISYYSL